MTELIKPNLHNVLIHYPVALVTLGALIELLSFMYRRHSLRSAGRWMIFLGVLALLPALSSGLYAAHQTLHAEEGQTWSEVKKAAPLNDHQWELLSDHFKLNLAGTLILVVVVVVFVGSSDRWRRKLYPVHLVLLLLGLATMGAGAHHGGEMVFDGLGTKAAIGSTEPATLPTDATLRDKIEHALPPIELHIVLAGLVMSMTVAALAISFRRCSESRSTDTVVDADIADALTARSMGVFGLDGGATPQRQLQTMQLDTVVASPTPAARFWLLASLLTLLTSAAGVWTFGIFNVKDFLEQIRDPEQKRLYFHAVFGTSLFVMPLILAIFTRFAPRARLFLFLLSLCILGLLAIQMWLGVLLFFDGGGHPGGLSPFRLN